MNYKKKPIRTISGVAPITVALPPRGCNHGVCTYCPTLNAPQSYTPESPAIRRAIRNNYDAYNQVKSRVKTLNEMGHSTEKVELIVIGGTFLQYPEDFKEKFILGCYNALNGKKSKTIEEAKKINEKTKNRMIALCIETRPDDCSKEQIEQMLSWGTTRVEMGVQIIDDEIYKKINRGHTVQDVIDATKRLKKAGFKIGYHLMPGLPSSNIKHDIKLFKKIFSSKNFKPDQIKIYPCQVLKGAILVNKYKEGGFIPYTREQTSEVILQIMKLTPRYCRIMRMLREIPQEYLVAGIKNQNVRKDVEDGIRENKIKINEIRFREIGFALRNKNWIDTKIKIKTTKYSASEGKEFFIEAINKDNILFGLLRLRLEKDKKIPAMVRELHVYGPTLKLGEKANREWQHRGLGKELMNLAEKTAKKKGYKKIKVISGVGVREYYKKLGYELDKEEIYMEKKL